MTAPADKLSAEWLAHVRAAYNDTWERRHDPDVVLIIDQLTTLRTAVDKVIFEIRESRKIGQVLSYTSCEHMLCDGMNPPVSAKKGPVLRG